MAHSVQARGLAGGLMLMMCGTMSASTAADGAHARVALPAFALAVEMPLVVALAEPSTARIEPASVPADDLLTAAEHDEAVISPRTTPTRAHSTQASRADVPARFFTINEVLAKGNIRTDAQPVVKLAAIDPATMMTDATPPADTKDGVEPFGLFTFRAPDGLLWAKWRKVQRDVMAEAPLLSQCEAEPDHCTPAAARFNAIVAEAKMQYGRARAELVNERINAAIRYTSDIAQHGVPDLWSAPLATLSTGLGDCEDYAIAKYVALRHAGVADGDLHLLLVRDKAVRMDHAVLAVRDSGHWLILDNRWSRVAEDTDLRQFAPLFALDEQGVKLFAAPYAAADSHSNDKGAFTAGADQGAILTDPAPATDAEDGASSWTPAPLLL